MRKSKYRPETSSSMLLIFSPIFTRILIQMWKYCDPEPSHHFYSSLYDSQLAWYAFWSTIPIIDNFQFLRSTHAALMPHPRHFAFDPQSQA